MGVFLTLGTGWLLTGPSVSLSTLLGGAWLMLWPILLVVSGVCGFISAIYARRDEGLSLLTERVALIGMGGFCFVYITALVIRMGLGPWVTEVLFGFILTACIWRYLQVRTRIKWCKRVGRTTAPRWRP